MADDEFSREPDIAQEGAKKAWIAPAVTKVMAGSAEAAGARGDDGFDAGTS